jgi:hypothetical protein
VRLRPTKPDHSLVSPTDKWHTERIFHPNGPNNSVLKFPLSLSHSQAPVCRSPDIQKAFSVFTKIAALIRTSRNSQYVLIINFY